MPACPWYESMALCATNLAMLPAIILAYRRGHPYPATYFACVAAVSLLYHACDCGVHCFAFPFGTYLTLDFVCSHGMIPMLCAFLMAIESWKARAVVYQLCLVACVALVLTDKDSWPFRFGLLGAGLLALAAKFVLCDGCRFRPDRHRYGLVLLGLGLIGLGASLFGFQEQDTGVPRWIGHSIWHAAVFAGTAFVVCGVSPSSRKTERRIKPFY